MASLPARQERGEWRQASDLQVGEAGVSTAARAAVFARHSWGRAKRYFPAARNQKYAQSVQVRRGGENRTQKIPSRSGTRTFTLTPIPMSKPLLLTALAASLTLATGCSMFSKKNPQAKESSAIASEVEQTYRRRWVDKRVSELTTQGVTADAARTQAENEFREKYGFDERPKK